MDVLVLLYSLIYPRHDGREPAKEQTLSTQSVQPYSYRIRTHPSSDTRLKSRLLNCLKRLINSWPNCENMSPEDKQLGDDVTI